MIWQVMLDSGATLPFGWPDRERARADLRRYNAKARASQAAMARGDELVALRLAVAIVSFKPRKMDVNSGKAKGGRARAAKLSPERRSEIAKEAAKRRWARQRGLQEA
jgi:hypothetical protein